MTCTWIVSFSKHPFLKYSYRFVPICICCRCSLFLCSMFIRFFRSVELREAISPSFSPRFKIKRAGTETNQHHKRKCIWHSLCTFFVTLQIWYLPFDVHLRIRDSLSRVHPKTLYLHGIPYSQMGGRSASSVIQLLRRCDFVAWLLFLQKRQKPLFFRVQIVDSDGMMTPCALVHMVPRQESIFFVVHVKEKRVIFHAGIEHCM